MALSTPPSLARPAALCLVAAPLLLTVADVLQLRSPGTVPWTVILWAAFVVFVPAIFTVAALLRERAPRWALVGGDLVLLAGYGWIAAEVLGSAAAAGELAAAARMPVRAAG